jgi:hypothetical protein
MTRRCRPGQRARCIKGMNEGRVVLVVKPLVGHEFNGSSWPEPIYPWIVAALGAPLRTKNLDSGTESSGAMTVVLCDLDLEPLGDGDDGLHRSTEKERPLRKPGTRKTKLPAPEISES